MLLFLILAAALLGLLRPVSDWVGNISQGQSPSPKLLVGGGVAVLVLVAIVGLDAIAEHFWCRYLCPLGGQWRCYRKSPSCAESCAFTATIVRSVWIPARWVRLIRGKAYT